MAKQFDKFFVFLAMHCSKLNRSHRYPFKGSRPESIGAAIAQTCKQRALIRRYDRRKLQEIPDEEHLNAAERLVNVAIDTERAIDRVQQIGPNHRYFVDHNSLKTLESSL